MGIRGTSELLHDFSPHIKVYKNGVVERLIKDKSVPASYDPKTRVHSRDVTIPNSGLSARIYVPDNLGERTKIPFVIYVHGGSFCLYSSSSSIYHTHLNSLVSEANVVAVSPDYRLAPESPHPGLQRGRMGRRSMGHDPRVRPVAGPVGGTHPGLLRGGQCRVNIAHQLAVRAGTDPARAAGLVIVHPFFGEDGKNPLWEFLCPRSEPRRDTRLNPTIDLSRMRRELAGCGWVLVCVGEKDFWKRNALKYYEVLKEGGREWKGEVALWESKRKVMRFTCIGLNVTKLASF